MYLCFFIIPAYSRTTWCEIKGDSLDGIIGNVISLTLIRTGENFLSWRAGRTYVQQLGCTARQVIIPGEYQLSRINERNMFGSISGERVPERRIGGLRAGAPLPGHYARLAGQWHVALTASRNKSILDTLARSAARMGCATVLEDRTGD